MSREELLAQWREEANRGMKGWDFSHIQDRYLVDPLPWNYVERVKEFLRPGVRLLDMGTGGGEVLLSLRHPYQLTSVTEGWEPNLELCRKKLSPLGITVKSYDSEKAPALPFGDDSFDLVIDRHESYDLAEVHRVLKNGGFFSHSRWAEKIACPWQSDCFPGFPETLWGLTWRMNFLSSGKQGFASWSVTRLFWRAGSWM